MKIYNGPLVQNNMHSVPFMEVYTILTWTENHLKQEYALSDLYEHQTQLLHVIYS